MGLGASYICCKNKALRIVANEILRITGTCYIPYIKLEFVGSLLTLLFCQLCFPTPETLYRFVLEHLYFPLCSIEALLIVCNETSHHLAPNEG